VVGYLWLVFLFVSFVVCCVPFWDVSMPLFVLSMKQLRGSTKGGQLITSSFLFGGSRAWLTRIHKTPNAYQNIGSLILDPEARVSIFHHLRTLPSHTKRLLEDLAPRNLERTATFGRFQNRRWILRSHTHVCIAIMLRHLSQYSWLRPQKIIGDIPILDDETSLLSSVISSGNQKWQWKISNLSWIFQLWTHL
jgi:hypothetical protein